MAIKSETKTLQLTFVDGASKNVSYSISNPKADLTKATVDTAAQSHRRQQDLCYDGRRQFDSTQVEPDRNPQG
jgi:hypothetical protein